MPDDDDLKEIKEQGKALTEKLKKWDEEMVQRKSKAYDDVENFPNKFTAEYIFLINQTESAIPRVTQASKDRRSELDQQWKTFESAADELLNTDIPALQPKAVGEKDRRSLGRQLEQLNRGTGF